MTDYCDLLIEYHEACIELLRVTHKYLHENDLLFDYRINARTTIGQLLDQLPQLRDKLGNDPVDEMTDVGLKLIAALRKWRNLTGMNPGQMPLI